MRRDNDDDRILLWKACHEGDKEALSSVSIKYRKPVCDYLHKIGTNGLAEDICQTMFLKICAKQCKYDGGSDVKNYLFGFARKIRNQLLTSVNKEINGLNWEEAKDDLRIPEFPSPEERFSQSEFRRILYEKIAELPPKSRQAVQLVYREGKTRKEAAIIAKCDSNTFRARLNYGLRYLRKNIKKDGRITIGLTTS